MCEQRYPTNSGVAFLCRMVPWRQLGAGTTPVPKRMFVVPGDLRRKAVAQRGEEGRAWIERLPLILEHCRQQWNLTCASPVVYPSNAAHYLAQARRRDGTTVVLKAHAPTGEFLQEALRLCAGRGMARLLDADMSNQALLLEQLSPGTP
jgi:streptomycin 6-kinase